MIRQEEDGIWHDFSEQIAAHHEDVFACLTSSGGLSRWFPIDARIELRRGGTLVLSWDRDFTRTTTVTILDYNAGGMIVWDWNASYEDIHAPIYWRVDPDVERGSIIRFRQGPFRDDVASLLALAEEAASWRWQVCNLRCVLEASHDMRKTRPL